MTYLPNLTGTQVASGNAGLVKLSEPDLSEEEIAIILGDFVLGGNPAAKVDHRKDPQTAANTVVSAVQAERDGVRGTMITMGNGDTIFKPGNGPADMTIVFEQDNSTGHSVRTLYDQYGNYVITMDSERGLVNRESGPPFILCAAP